MEIQSKTKVITDFFLGAAYEAVKELLPPGSERTAEVNTLLVQMRVLYEMMKLINFPVHWDGKGLPPIGCDVIFNTSSQGDVVGTVVGWEEWPTVKGSDFDHRILVHLLYKDTNISNARHLHELTPVPKETKNVQPTD